MTPSKWSLFWSSDSSKEEKKTTDYIKEVPLRMKDANAKASAIREKIRHRIREQTSREPEAAQVQRLWLQEFHCIAGCTFDGLKATDPVRVDKIRHIMALDYSNIDPDCHDAAKKILPIVHDEVAIAMRLYGDMPIDHHIGIGVKKIEEQAYGGRVKSRSERDVSGDTRRSYVKVLEFNNVHAFQNVDEMRALVDHELGHLAAAITQPDCLPVIEALAEAHRLLATGVRMKDDNVPDSVIREKLAEPPVQILAAEKEGGWGVPEFEAIKYGGDVVEALYRGFLHDLTYALRGDVRSVRYIFQAIVAQWNVKRALFEHMNHDQSEIMPTLDQWLQGASDACEERGIVAFAERYRSRNRAEIPEGLRILWTPSSSGGELSCMRCTRRKAAHKSTMTSPATGSAETHVYSIQDDIFASFDFDNKDSVIALSIPEVRSASPKEPWATLANVKMHISFTIEDPDREVLAENKDSIVLDAMKISPKILTRILVSNGLDLQKKYYIRVKAQAGSLTAEKRFSFENGVMSDM